MKKVNVYKDDNNNFDWEYTVSKMSVIGKTYTDMMGDKWEAIIQDNGDERVVWVRKVDSNIMLLAYTYRKSSFPNGFDDDEAIVEFISDNLFNMIWGI